MPLVAGVPEAGVDALVTGTAFLGMEGSCFFPKGGRAGLAFWSPGPPCSSLSDLYIKQNSKERHYFKHPFKKPRNHN